MMLMTATVYLAIDSATHKKGLPFTSTIQAHGNKQFFGRHVEGPKLGTVIEKNELVINVLI